MANVDPVRTANLLTPGSGTPWEDRDSLGIVSAFFKTAFRMMGSPVQTLDSIRRLRDRKDAMMYAVGCGCVWFVSVWIHAFIAYRRLLHSPEYLAGLMPVPKEKCILHFDAYWYFMGWFVAALAVSAGLVFLLRVGATIYYSMVSGEDMKGRGSPELAYNCLAYCLSPSLLAVIPFVGPIAALLWGYYLIMQPAGLRMRVKRGGAIIAATISVFVCVAAMAVVLYLGRWLWPTYEIFDPTKGHL
jgi:hypothetical protein